MEHSPPKSVGGRRTVNPNLWLVRQVVWRRRVPGSSPGRGVKIPKPPVKTTAVFSLGETNPTEVGEWSISRQKAWRTSVNPNLVRLVSSKKIGGRGAISGEGFLVS
ncbi:MAG: hypothetical protein A2452_10880 [Candidatus Firestonebacteria bacterium RIFOXYC2_FULL_39_67]|nr:MAG: hypothetical protein A2452_10880 [Candidatus Firestonebacteria bacterium RIFOXYC2_FULL_39_67]